MSPRTRINSETVYHVIARFVGSQWFIQSDVERTAYLTLLGDSLKHSDWRCFSFAVMSNHVHLAMLAGRRPLRSWARETHAPFARWINERMQRIGAVFTRGPKAIAVRPDGIATLVAYIHQNPVRAGVVAAANETTWTSHQMYTGNARCLPWVDTELGLGLAGFRDGDALDRWINADAIDRAWLDSFARDPAPRRGRPSKQFELAAMPAHSDVWITP